MLRVRKHYFRIRILKPTFWTLHEFFTNIFNLNFTFVSSHLMKLWRDISYCWMKTNFVTSSFWGEFLKNKIFFIVCILYCDLYQLVRVVFFQIHFGSGAARIRILFSQDPARKFLIRPDPDPQVDLQWEVTSLLSSHERQIWWLVFCTAGSLSFCWCCCWGWPLWAPDRQLPLPDK